MVKCEIINLVILLSVYSRNRRLRLRLRENDDKQRATPCPSQLEAHLRERIDCAGPGRQSKPRGRAVCFALAETETATAPRPIFPHCVQCVPKTHSGNTLAQKDIPRTHAPARVRRLSINGDKHDDKASSDRGRGPFDWEQWSLDARGGGSRKDRGAAAAASSFRPGRSSEFLGNWLSVAAGMRRGGRL
jgi:hypothetical protein